MAIAILHYLRDHPSAKDSAQGIAKWWVGEEREVVEKALALLLAERVIEKKRHVYQLAAKKIATEDLAGIEKILRQLQKTR